MIRGNDESPLVTPLREILTVATGPVVILGEELARRDRVGVPPRLSFAARMLGDAGPAPPAGVWGRLSGRSSRLQP